MAAWPESLIRKNEALVGNRNPLRDRRWPDWWFVFGWALPRQRIPAAKFLDASIEALPL